ncbi:hypothetical protein BASA61_000611 [Batrachochytrium salamandrivorans]|nr:hypothetical protein BASA61_000611 [Batrachochytrium salamandrivorans]
MTSNRTNRQPTKRGIPAALSINSNTNSTSSIISGSKRKSALPKGWPSTLTFTDALIWVKEVPRQQQAALTERHDHKRISTLRSHTRPLTRGPNRQTQIRLVSDPKHPAFGQRSLHASINIPPHTHIIDYIGIVTPSSISSTTSDYIISFYDDLAIDAELTGNEARFVNDYRGVADRPTVQFDLYQDPVTGRIAMGLWSLGMRIMKGDELLVSYGKGFWKARTSDTP